MDELHVVIMAHSNSAGFYQRYFGSGSTAANKQRGAGVSPQMGYIEDPLIHGRQNAAAAIITQVKQKRKQRKKRVAKKSVQVGSGGSKRKRKMAKKTSKKPRKRSKSKYAFFN